jgi:hypothetical protein
MAKKMATNWKALRLTWMRSYTLRARKEIQKGVPLSRSRRMTGQCLPKLCTP